MERIITEQARSPGLSQAALRRPELAVTLPGFDDSLTPADWLQQIAALLQLSSTRTESSIRTTLSVGIQRGRLTLFVPADMASLQPASLRWLTAFAGAHDLRMVEDRRQVDVRPLREQRLNEGRELPLGLAMLLAETGMPGKPRKPSSPDRLGAGNAALDLPTLVSAAARSMMDSKSVSLPANPMLEKALGDDCGEVKAWACRLLTSEMTTILSQFHAKGLHAIGYSTGNQYALQVLLAGGKLDEGRFWCPPASLSQHRIGFQLFPGKTPEQDVGILHVPHFIDLADSPNPWWFEAEKVSD
ncbi:MAG: hypothetical protein CSB44_08020 [Gammaproteobacteria bacterium]|nr:MAG: hypothetical protein CSB44_08020 [Gammaproteobacteria bacterium]